VALDATLVCPLFWVLNGNVDSDQSNEQPPSNETENVVVEP
jgi:hypothetical protein